eukprot:2276441-Ditylum_brightwellii.AAC.1
MSPNGNHIGLYKAWLRPPEDMEILNSDTFFKIIEQLLNLTMRYNIPFTWWIMILNLYLCKQAGNFKYTD